MAIIPISSILALFSDSSWGLPFPNSWICNPARFLDPFISKATISQLSIHGTLVQCSFWWSNFYSLHAMTDATPPSLHLLHAPHPPFTCCMPPPSLHLLHAPHPPFTCCMPHPPFICCMPPTFPSFAACPHPPFTFCMPSLHLLHALTLPSLAACPHHPFTCCLPPHPPY